ncbi:neprilysin-1-like isoform X2 [Diachasmimorpha longicaudata]|uniref:neprilysin-1-like isoform X2 n=1 Tax=Diachasmimorpha longicaudata TaxID=58733 RepID=UPI0030B8E606
MFQFPTRTFFNFNIIITLSLISLSQSIPVKRETADSESGTVHLASLVNELTSSLDESVDPCTDFYTYTCGHWLEHHPVKPGYLTWSNMNEISSGLRPKMESLITANDSDTDSEAIRKARKVYAACMDTEQSEEVGIEPIMSILNENGGWPLIMKIEDWRAKNISWQEIFPKFMKTFGSGALFHINVESDPKTSSISRLAINEAKLVVKESELDGEPTDQAKRAYNRYKSQVINLFRKELGTPPEDLSTSSQWDDLDQFEKILASITEGDHDLKEIDEWYTLMTIDEFQAFYDSAGMNAPNAKINWLEMIREVLSLTPEITVDGSEQILVPSKGYFTKLAQLLNQTTPEIVVNYIMWTIIPDLSLYANNALKNPLIGFYQQRPGVDPIGDRQDGCVVSSQLARAIGYEFIQKWSSQETKEAVSELVENMKKGLEQHIQESSWLDSDTKNLAAGKIHVMGKSISYPDYFNADYINNYYAEFNPSGSFFENELGKRALELKSNLRQLHKPTDKSLWPSEPTELNAFYMQIANAVVVPAGILQPPLFELNRPKILNYAAIGPLIGHEVSHALDSQGRLYNKDGDVVTWWPQSAIDRYEKNTECFVNQYGSYKIYEKDDEIIYLNGNLTLEENISDSTGLKLTWDAYKIFREKEGTTPKIPGLEKFTDDQIFFITYANAWCSSEDQDYLKQYGNIDEHSPAKPRINGAVSNNAGFQAAFNCPGSSALNPPNKCSIWQ